LSWRRTWIFLLRPVMFKYAGVRITTGLPCTHTHKPVQSTIFGSWNGNLL
jgi:hypothetical protein